MQSCNWNDVSCTLVANTRVATNDLSGERSTPPYESHLLMGIVVNADYIESQRLLEDARECSSDDCVKKLQDMHLPPRIILQFVNERYSIRK